MTSKELKKLHKLIKAEGKKDFREIKEVRTVFQVLSVPLFLYAAYKIVIFIQAYYEQPKSFAWVIFAMVLVMDSICFGYIFIIFGRKGPTDLKERIVWKRRMVGLQLALWFLVGVSYIVYRA